MSWGITLFILHPRIITTPVLEVTFLLSKFLSNLYDKWTIKVCLIPFCHIVELNTLGCANFFAAN